jgi:hypothetical protein
MKSELCALPVAARQNEAGCVVTKDDIIKPYLKPDADAGMLDQTMSNQLPSQGIARLSDAHPKPTHLRYQYGTAGFRTLCVHPDPVNRYFAQDVHAEDPSWIRFFFEWAFLQD